MLARTYGEAATAALGQPVVVENKAGASGTIAAAQAAKAAPDGHTLLVSGPSTVITAPYLFNKLDYEPEKDLVPITCWVRAPSWWRSIRRCPSTPSPT